jgi:hypothetical protein
MIFVPVVTPPSPPSPRAQELGATLAYAIEDLRSREPDLNSVEIRQALAIAAQKTTRGASPELRKIFAAIALLIALLTGFLIFKAFNTGVARPSMLFIILGTLFVGSLLAALFLILKNRSGP